MNFDCSEAQNRPSFPQYPLPASLLALRDLVPMGYSRCGGRGAGREEAGRDAQPHGRQGETSPHPEHRLDEGRTPCRKAA